MRKCLKWLSLIVVFVVLLVIIGAVSLLAWFDPNDYKPQISQYLSNTTGYPLQIKGPITLNVLPTPHLRINTLEIASRPGFPEPNLATLGELDLRLALKPLLQKKIISEQITLRHLQLNLAINARGQSNWQPSLTTASSHPATHAEATPAASPQKGFSFQVKKVAVQQARINWHDQSLDRTTSLHFPSITLQGINPHGAPSQLRLQVSIEDNQTPVVADFRANGQIIWSEASQTIQVKPLQLKGDLSANHPKAKPVDFTANLALLYDQNQQQLSVSQLSGSLGDAKFSGDFSTHLAQSQWQGKLAVQSLALAEIDSLMPLALSADLQQQFSPINGHFSLKHQANQLTINGFQAQCGKTKIQGELHLNNSNPNAPQMNGKIMIDQLSFNKLRAEHVNFSINGQNNRWLINPITAVLYGGNFQGALIVDARGKAPTFQLQSSLSQVQLQPLLSQLADLKGVSGHADLTAQLSTAGNDTAQQLQQLQGRVNIDIKDGMLVQLNPLQAIETALTRYKSLTNDPGKNTNGLPFSQMHASFTIQRGIARNKDFSLNANTMRMQGSGEINLPRNTIDFKIATKLSPETTQMIASLFEMNELLNFTIPMHITGTLDNPSIKVSYTQFISQLMASRLGKKAADLIGPDTERAVKENLDKAAQQLEKTGKQLKKSFESILGR